MHWSITKEKQDVIEVAKHINNKGKHNAALKLLMKARKKAIDNEYRLKIDFEIGLVYYSMEEYKQTVSILKEIQKNDVAEWSWKVYFYLAKALSHTKGFYSNETLETYISCVNHRKKFDEYGKTDFRSDIYLCHEIGEIYSVKKNYAAANAWFRDEMILREACLDIGTKNKIKDLFEKAAVLAKKNHAEDALRLYEEIAYLVGNHIGESCDKYAIVQLEMGRLFWKGYVTPRYDLAFEFAKKGILVTNRI